MSLKLSQSHHQNLQMTLSLAQGLTLLQMPQYDLGQWLEEEIDRNPLLQRKEKKMLMPSAIDPALLPQKPSLYEHLTNQIQELFSSPHEKQIAFQLMEELDEKGFLSIPWQELLDALGIDLEMGQQILFQLQTLDPPGIFARNLQESFLLQLKAQGLESSFCFTLIQNHFQDLLNGKIQQDSSIFKTLKLHPADAFRVEPTQWVIPDLEIKKIDHHWIVQLKEEYLPPLIIDPAYLQLKLHNKEEKQTIRMWKQSSQSIFHALKRRKQILLSIAKLIIRRQHSYLDGKGHLIPCNLSKAAHDLKLHVSTLSRAIQNKHIITPLGILPLRFFFSKETIAIKERLKALIAKENPQDPITDEKLALLLQKANIHLARRTIAKYRKELKIPTSRAR